MAAASATTIVPSPIVTGAMGANASRACAYHHPSACTQFRCAISDEAAAWMHSSPKHSEALHSSEYEHVRSIVQFANPQGGASWQSAVALTHCTQVSSMQWAGSQGAEYEQTCPAVQLAWPHGGTAWQSCVALTHGLHSSP